MMSDDGHSLSRGSLIDHHGEGNRAVAFFTHSVLGYGNEAS
jgi:hypothetical protein